eukprot:2599105-Rhodomonas_salina.1
MSIDEAASEMSSFSLVGVTPKSAAWATADMRRLALEDKEAGGAKALAEDMEKVAKGGAIGGGAKSSLTCSYCPKVVKPSLFDRATFCEVCEACLIETKCLKEALVAIARVEGALDAK